MTRQIWSCFTHASQDGAAHPEYGDVLGERYEYDSHVPNRHALAVGDILVVRDSEAILGHGAVHEIATRPKTKTMERSPECGRAAGIPRKRLRPTYRCDRGHEFDVPDLKDVEITAYTASYAASWLRLDPPVPVRALERAYAGGDQQNAIRRLNTEAALALFRGAFDLESYLNVELLLAGAGPRGGHIDIVGRARVGQRAYRRMLLDRFGARCAVTGAQPEEVLDAAHLASFALHEEHRPDGGLLLRADVHRLFDRLLVAFDPETWRSCVAPYVLQRYPALAEFDGRLMAIDQAVRPDQALIASHFNQAQVFWAEEARR